MEVETVPTLDEIRRRREREVPIGVTLETLDRDLEGMHAQQDMMRDGVWRLINTVEELRKDIKALTAALASLSAKVGVLDAKLDGMADLLRALKPQQPKTDPHVKAAVLAMAACVVLLTLKQVGAL